MEETTKKEGKDRPLRVWAIVALLVSVIAIGSLGSYVDSRYQIGSRIRQFFTISQVQVKYVEATPKVDQAAEKKEREILKIAYCLQSLQPKLSLDVAQVIAKHTLKECNERGINIALWIALMFSESSLDPMKSSTMGAHGLCQVRYSIWKEQPELLDNGVSVRDKLFWIDLNIKCGTTIFKKFYEESGRKIGVALWRYNSGQTKLPEGKRAYDIDYVARITYYTYKVNEILEQESATLHTINDPEAQAESISPIVAPAHELKDKPAKKVTKHE